MNDFLVIYDDDYHMDFDAVPDRVGVAHNSIVGVPSLHQTKQIKVIKKEKLADMFCVQFVLEG